MTSPDHPPDCPTDAALERHALGGVVDDREAEHVLGCPRCRSRIEAIRANNELIDEVAAAHRAGGPSLPEPGELDVPGHHVDAVVSAGGQGVVYRATQLAANRTVALKVLLAGSFATARQRRRFEREIELVANLRHPNIVVVHDSGTTHGGLPFFTMEYVEGVPLDEYADARMLDTHDRLALLSTVCHAVQHAHRHGVIHRDLKPANILVTATGEPKILDFGIARATDTDIQITTERTDVGQLIGTIPYMSPEQVAGDLHDIDVRSDVYALGVVAYELLARRMPYDLEQKLLHEAVRIIREDDPAPLSSVDRLYRGDVETIIAKALAKDRTRRYQSARDLAADIERYLADEPIEAHPPSAVYHLRKFARRHRAIVLGTAAVLTAIVAGGVLSLVLAVSATRAREVAQAAAADATLSRDEAEEITAFLETMITDVRPSQLGRDVLVRDVLDAASAGMDDLGGGPTVEARLRRALGRAYAALGDYAAAETHLRKALTILVRERGSAHPDAVAAMVDLANLLDTAGDEKEAGELLQDALTLQRRAGSDGDPATLRIRTILGRHRLFRAELDLAETQLIAARDGWMQREGADHPETLAVLDLLAHLYQMQGDGEKTEQMLREILDTQRGARGPTDPATHLAMSSLGVFLLGQQRADEAETLYRELAAERATLHGPEAPRTLTARNHLALALAAQGRDGEAETILLETVEASGRTFSATHPETLMTIRRLADLYAGVDRCDEAETLYRRVIEDARARVGETHAMTSETIRRLEDLHERCGRIEEAADDDAPARAGPESRNDA